MYGPLIVTECVQVPWQIQLSLCEPITQPRNNACYWASSGEAESHSFSPHSQKPAVILSNSAPVKINPYSNYVRSILNRLDDPWVKERISNGCWCDAAESNHVAQYTIEKQKYYLWLPQWQWNIVRLHGITYKVWRFNSRNCSRVSLMIPSTFGHVPSYVYMSYRPNESFVP
jgi:hypothetical protein